MSAENIRDEVNRGARIVVYTYCVSFLVVTLKRSGGLRLVKPGQSRAAAGLPFVLVSLVLGWWGFPWGPIYTIETIYRNLSGGIDVTEDVLRQLLPAVQSAPRSIPPALQPAPTPRRFNYRAVALMVGTVVAATLIGISVYCYRQQQDLSVVLVSGLDVPYAVTLNGQEYKLAPHRAQELRLPEGDFSLADASGGQIVGVAQTLGVRVPFFDHLSHHPLLIVNPDRAAVLAREDVVYYADGTTPAKNEKPGFEVYANACFRLVDKPDYVLELAPQRISMPNGATRHVKTRLHNLGREDDPADYAAILAEKAGYAAMKEHLAILGSRRQDEMLLLTAVRLLKPADVGGFFRPRLTERPVLLEWHRYYQNAMEVNQPSYDLAAEYRSWAAAEPDNGALLYLFGRALADPVAARVCFQKALEAKEPCGYAHYAIGFNAMVVGRFEEALGQFDAAAARGVTSRSAEHYRRAALTALRQFDRLLAEIDTERKQTPLDVALAGERVNAAAAAGRPAAEIDKFIGDLEAAFRRAHTADSDLAEIDAYLRSMWAYQRGDEKEYLRHLSRIDGPAYRLRAAVVQGDLRAAEQVLVEQRRSDVSDQLLVYLLAERTADVAAAGRHFAAAVGEFERGSADYRSLARLLTAGEIDASAVCQATVGIDEKRMLLAAMTVRDPRHREVYRELAVRLNFSPEFPSHFLRRVLLPAEAAAAPAPSSL